MNGFCCPVCGGAFTDDNGGLRCDMVLNIFSPPELKEYSRVLRTGGILIRALPLEDHLWSLKAAVYDKPYMNPVPRMNIDNFNLVSVTDIRESIHVSPNADIQALFAMTPYCQKTSPSDRAQLDSLDELSAELSIRLAAYRKV